MHCYSTRGTAPPVDFRTALLQGLAPDGGLYLAQELPHFTPAVLASWRGLAFPDLAAVLSRHLIGNEFPAPVLDALVRDALNFPVPLRRLDERLWLLELFCGPTLAFKDFGARFLARVFGHLLAGSGRHATILVATSGDTGSAVAQGFAGVPAVRVVVLYPAGKVSAFQEAQMATLGGNVTAVRVPGTFDDCQRLVKGAFLDPALARLRLSSANSINIGRLLPQSFYYVASYLAALDEPRIEAGEPVVFSVPSGNLGNLTAGVMAARMGVAVDHFIAATNGNDVLPEYLDTGEYRPRPSMATMSNAMDVGDPSNFARLLALCGGTRAGVRAAVRGERVSEADTRSAIRRAYAQCGVVLDPHTAVAYEAACRHLGGQRPHRDIIVLATAHPAKFADAIREELGFEPELPEDERDWQSRPLLAVDLGDATQETFRALLDSLPD